MTDDQIAPTSDPDSNEDSPKASKRWPFHMVVSVTARVLYGVVAQLCIHRVPFITDARLFSAL